jgi:exodeoxyribonuclease VII small subunit
MTSSWRFIPRMARTSTTSGKVRPEGDAPAQPQPEPVSFERAVEELDALVEQMERGQLPLDRLLDDYRRGSELLVYCRRRLQAVEQQVKVLEEGQLEPWSAG